jgi:hypothetical protein
MKDKTLSPDLDKVEMLPDAMERMEKLVRASVTTPSPVRRPKPARKKKPAKPISSKA